MKTPRRRFPGLLALAAASCVLALGSCGGGSSNVAPSTGCSLEEQKSWLHGYMWDWYLWFGLSPNPPPAAYNSVQAYFDALLYLGDSVVPADRWSYISDSASYNQFFEEGKTLGYGLFVNGLELKLPLKVRMVEPQSPAAVQGLARGDVILSVNGRSAADMIAANDFAVLNPDKAGDTLAVTIASGTGSKTVTLTAATYTLTPVPVSRVLTLANGTKAGYLMMKDFITQAEAPLAAAFSSFRAAGATELILDLRYNGGGRISTSTVLASLIAGNLNNGKLFTSLNYNVKQSSQNTSYRFSSANSGFSRVVVLTGERTCSASELVVNGLKPYVQVITVGGQTCGKPFGFNPVSSCSSTYSAVNFESFNALGEGRYYDGIAATCAATDQFGGQLGDTGESLTAAAVAYLQNGNCPAVALADAAQRKQSSTPRSRPVGAPEPGDHRGMVAD